MCESKREGFARGGRDPKPGDLPRDCFPSDGGLEYHETHERPDAPENYLAGRTYEEQQKIREADLIAREVQGYTAWIARERRRLDGLLIARGEKRDPDTFPFVYRVEIHLGPKEWGNDVMHVIAREYLAEREGRFTLPTIVRVQEHGGWHLSFAMIDGEMTVVGSANDRSVFKPAAERLRRRAYAAPSIQLPEIRRP